jgi:phosphopentomutase
MGRRAITIVLDGVGAGALPDAAAYGDTGANSLVNAAAAVGGLRLPVLQGMGLGNIAPIEGVAAAGAPTASWGRMAEQSPGKDSTSGHWELMGCPLTAPFPTYPDGFPPEVIERFERETGTTILGNVTASGTEIIEELGARHMRTGSPIVYTSADSVFQIAAHVDVIPPEELYRLCLAARRILVPPHHVGRVIARPFSGAPGSFVRTPGRRDFSFPPPAETLLDILSAAGRTVVTVGKIHDLFAGRGIDRIIGTSGNAETMLGMAETVSDTSAYSFLFANLIDFDMLWGHRRDAARYAGGLEAFDSWLGGFVRMLEPGTLLCITADHGCDPTAGGSDHTREYAPLIAKIIGRDAGVSLGTRDTFADVGATIAAFLGVALPAGTSFLEALS